MSQEKVIEYLNERTEGLPVITFNAFKSRIANAVTDIYFGKTLKAATRHFLQISINAK